MRFWRPVKAAPAWTGDPDRIAALYRRLGPAIYRQCLRLLRDRDEAADATHEVFMKLLAEPELQDEAHAAAWVYRVATRHCLNHLRNARRRGQALHSEALAVGERVAEDLHLERNLIQRVLGDADEENCTVAVGVLVDGIDQTELAEILGLSRRTVARRLARFLEDARRLLQGGVP